MSSIDVYRISRGADRIAALEAENVSARRAADKWYTTSAKHHDELVSMGHKLEQAEESIVELQAEVKRLRTTVNRRADRIYGDLRPREELLRRAGIALAKRISEVTGACPYPIDDEACSLDCPPRGERTMCWAKWAAQQACPAFVGCAGDCFDCDYAGTAREEAGDDR